jgi:hypothetical protein
MPSGGSAVQPVTLDFRTILQVLTDHQVAFLVVGGVSAVLQGAPLNTFDLDLVHCREPENLNRLLAALQDLDSYYRGQGRRRIKPDLFHLDSPGHQLLSTRSGYLDVLGTVGSVGAERGYEDLLPHTVETDLGDGLRVRLLDLPTLIELKEQAGRDKDKAVLPVLRRTLEEQQKASRPPEQTE